MGDSHTGGGSVEWSVDVDDASWTMSAPKSGGNGKGPRQGGVDNAGDPGKYFTVSIEAPTGQDANRFLKDLKEGGLKADVASNRVYLNLQIEKHNPEQIRISWGNSVNHRGKALRRGFRA